MQVTAVVVSDLLQCLDQEVVTGNQIGKERLRLLLAETDEHRIRYRLYEFYRDAAQADLPETTRLATTIGFWAAVRDVFPATKAQRCWFHKIANVLAALPKSAHPGAKKTMAEIWNAEDKDHAEQAAKRFAVDYGLKWPKAAAKITDDLEVLLAFYDYPAEHWIHLRTTNPIESTFATVRLRQRPRLPRRRHRDGVQAHRVRPTTLARRQRPPPGRPRPRRRHLQERHPRRTRQRPEGRRPTRHMTHQSTGLEVPPGSWSYRR